ncbi:hypothetical protein [Streptomyces beijiangensis]|uniref:Uncharacterized protein n=2 Tax=Streptomyces beijiangensis TaxID=163361 RepID=A0A939F406_9ACTN|nr:hypothetical protein [Streptomyces beijiangensis]MBO0511283.1 hypothetical protein [Streptomyces beijiangensis]
MQPMGAPNPTPPAGRGAGVRRGFGFVIALVGVLLLTGGSALAAHAYSNSRQTTPNYKYGLSLWKDEPVDHLFPETLGGKDADYEGKLSNTGRALWRRLGISQETACDKGLSAKTLAKAKELGCEAALRATYVDPTGNTIATVALMVIPGGESKRREMADFFDGREGLEAAVHALAVPGSLAEGWTDAVRSGSGLLPVGGDSMPYVVAATAGAADGRVAGGLPGEWGEEDVDGKMDRTSWQGSATDLASSFVSYIDEIQMGSAQ